jgi:adenosine deaminase
MLLDFAFRNGVPLPYLSRQDVLTAYRFTSLDSFLAIYWAGLAVLRTERDFYDLTCAYLRRAHRDHVVHAEVYVTPADHTERGVPFAAMLDGMLSDFADLRAECGISGGIILGIRRHRPIDEALAAIEQARPYRDKILALGLGGPELGHSPSKFSTAFAAARELGWHTVAHAGEEGSARYVAEALDTLRVDRIDHRVRCEDDPLLLRRLAETSVPLTICPLSNVKLRVFRSIEEHNLLRLLRAGLRVTVNSDDPCYFGGYVNENYRAVQALRATETELATIARNSLIGAFIDGDARSRHPRAIDALRPGASP